MYTSFKSKISYSQINKINNSFTELYPPIIFTMPKSKKASHMGNLITKEELYEENMQLKNALKKAKKEVFIEYLIHIYNILNIFIRKFY